MSGVETNNLRSARAILAAIKVRLESLTINPAGEKAFQRVEIVDILEYEWAVSQLALNDNRMAIIAYLDETWNPKVERVIMTMLQTQRIGIALTDRKLGDNKAANLGDGGTTPGAHGLKDLVSTNLSGILLDTETDKDNAIYMSPQNVQRVAITADDKERFPGRAILEYTFEARGGWMQVGVGGAAIR